MRSLLQRIIPFIFLGIVLVIFIAGIVLVSYISLIGAGVGLILFLASWLRNFFFPQKNLVPPSKTVPKQGRTFDHDEK